MPTIMELFKSKELNFPGGSTADGLVDSAAEENKGGIKQGIKNFVDQELNGLRVELLNNPQIYGFQQNRIRSQSTKDKDIQIEGRAIGGLSLAARGAFNSPNLLGIPQTELPTRVVNLKDNVRTDAKDFVQNPSNNPVTQELYGKNGTELGKLLKQSGGDPKQIIGGALSAAKKGLRGAIFKRAKPEDQFPKKLSDDNRNFSDKENSSKKASGLYSKYVGDANNDGGIKEHMGIGYASNLDLNTPATYRIPEKEDDKLIIPFWINGITDEPDKKQFFRTTITGLTETSTPTWTGGKFIGNPYSYFTYEGVDRGISFNLNVYCMSSSELLTNWKKLEYLTSKVYPTITEDVMVAPFIKFRLGDIYNNRTGFIESLSYTMPDAGTWEIDTQGILLPKFIDVAITIKLIETPGDEEKLYDYNGEIEGFKEYKPAPLPSGESKTA